MSMDGSQSSIVTLFFLVAAVLIFLKLRSVLGRRTGDEAARFERYRAERAAAEAHAAKADSKIVTLPRREREQPVDQPAPRETDAERAQRMTQFAGGNATLAQGLIAIAGADRTFDPAEFLRGGKAAYETIVTAFADGNRATLKDLLSPDVMAGFSAAIDDRTARKDIIEQSFVGIKGAEVTNAALDGRLAHVTVRFVSDLISATRNAAGEVTSGDPKRIKEVTDIWTFVRDVGAATPNWHLDSTQAAT
jgi:predicted lipid-binding transport protein (Tim44 family)